MSKIETSLSSTNSIQQYKTTKDFVSNYQQKIDFWEQEVKDAQEICFEKNFDSSDPSVLEFIFVKKFMDQFLKKRFMDIQRLPDEIQKKYLQVLPPFFFQDDIPRFLSHFFQINYEKKKLFYQKKNKLTRELHILLDVYKIRKTIRTLSILIKAIDDPVPFKSMFPKEKQLECLSNIKDAFQILFKRCIKKEYQKELYQNISAEIISPKAILKRKKEGFSYVQPHVIEKYDYRQQLFFMFFTDGMRAKVNGKIKDYVFNYLEFEIIKQEFLVDWVTKKLENNPTKLKIYKKHIINGVSIKDRIKDIPAKELEILQHLPLNTFNDIASEINEKIDTHLKTEIDPMSETVGEYSVFLNVFEQAKNLAKSSIESIKNIIKSSETPPSEEESNEKQAVKYNISKLKKNEIDFAYFDKSIGKYSSNLSILKVKMGSSFPQYLQIVNKLFNSTPQSLTLSRITPKHDWTLPYFIEEINNGKKIFHLLIIGAEVKSKSLGMGYSNSNSNKGTASNTLLPYYVYACSEILENLGQPVGTRKIKGAVFHEYSFMNLETTKSVIFFLDKVLNKPKEVSFPQE